LRRQRDAGRGVVDDHRRFRHAQSKHFGADVLDHAALLAGHAGHGKQVEETAERAFAVDHVVPWDGRSESGAENEARSEHP
jgi:hypothetical protein